MKKNTRKRNSDDEKYLDWIEELNQLQEDDRDQREQAREADIFCLEKDGQWEDDVIEKLNGRPRYTFDKTNPLIESIMSDIEDMNFGGNVKPSDGAATKDNALLYDGMIRSIQNMSKTESLYRRIARRIVRRGFDACIVKSKFADEWSFDQDLFVEQIPNSINRVWVTYSANPDSHDSDAAYVLTSLQASKYKKDFPDGSGISVDDNVDRSHDNNYQPDVVTIAERYYKKESMAEVAQLTDGSVVELNDDWKKIKDEMKDKGITIAEVNGKPRIKKVNNFKWYHRIFDGGGFLSEERETAFKTNPVVTFYGNHEVTGSESKITYSGAVLRLMDPQRVHNYSKSRDVEEGVLAPRPKWWMTKKQAAGHEGQISRMNISADPVQFFNPDERLPGYPQYGGGAKPNQHLTLLADQTAADMKEVAGVFDAMQGKFNSRQSEEAVRMQIDRGTGTSRKWVNALTDGIQRVNEILLETIPVVYDTKCQFNIVKFDGSEEMVTLNDEVYDQESGQMVKVNDLNTGKYKVTVEAGPAFTNRLEAGMKALIDYAALDPTIIEQGGDIMLKSIDAPLVDKLAERKRMAMVAAGMIPVSQMSDEEKEKYQQLSSQPPEPSADMVLAQAEMLKGQAAQMREKRELMKAQADFQTKSQQIEIDAFEAETGRMDTMIEADKAGAEIQKKEVEAFGKELDNAEKAAELTVKRFMAAPIT